MKSVLQNEKKCYVCYARDNLHDHHVFFGTANRKLSEKRGLKAWLCPRHHNMSNEGVHFNKQLDRVLKIEAQEYYEEHYGTREDFIKEFGKNYLD